jgi:hypothetical protein
MVTPVTPQGGVHSIITTGGVAVVAVNGGPNGGIITNPLLASDQGLVTAEVLFINAVTTATTSASGTNFALQPGQSWNIIPGQTTATSVNAATSGHAFSVMSW